MNRIELLDRIRREIGLLLRPRQMRRWEATGRIAAKDYTGGSLYYSEEEYQRIKRYILRDYGPLREEVRGPDGALLCYEALREAPPSCANCIHSTRHTKETKTCSTRHAEYYG